MASLADLRTDIEAWVQARHPDAQPITTGGQRVVFRVETPEASALKVWIVDDAAQHQRHVREVSALDQLDHDGLPRVITPIYQVEIRETPVAMYQEEWLNAAAIGQQLPNESTPRDDATARSFLRSSVGALAALHDAHIVHRDVSINNVLWDGTQAFLIDLGLAKHLDLESVTQTNERLPMTRVTASPEQLQGASTDLRAPTDIYSLGVVAFLFASGRHPFIRSANEVVDLSRILQRIFNQDVQGYAEGPTLELLKRMLHPVALYRPSASQILEALD